MNSIQILISRYGKKYQSMELRKETENCILQKNRK